METFPLDALVTTGDVFHSGEGLDEWRAFLPRQENGAPVRSLENQKLRHEAFCLGAAHISRPIVAIHLDAEGIARHRLLNIVHSYQLALSVAGMLGPSIFELSSFVFVASRLQFFSGESLATKGEVDTQLELVLDTPTKVDGPFRPSERLLRYISDGLSENAKLLQESSRKKFDEAREAQQHLDGATFENTLTDLISRIAFRLIDGKYLNSNVTEDRRFSVLFQHALLDVFPVLPSDFEKFQSLLRRELIDFLVAEGKLYGRWGRLKVKDSEIVYDLEKNPLRGTELDGPWNLAVPDD
jgi:hypothetical protein